MPQVWQLILPIETLIIFWLFFKLSKYKIDREKFIDSLSQKEHQKFMRIWPIIRLSYFGATHEDMLTYVEYIKEKLEEERYRMREEALPPLPKPNYHTDKWPFKEDT